MSEAIDILLLIVIDEKIEGRVSEDVKNRIKGLFDDLYSSKKVSCATYEKKIGQLNDCPSSDSLKNSDLYVFLPPNMNSAAIILSSLVSLSLHAEKLAFGPSSISFSLSRRLTFDFGFLGGLLNESSIVAAETLITTHDLMALFHGFGTIAFASLTLTKSLRLHSPQGTQSILFIRTSIPMITLISQGSSPSPLQVHVDVEPPSDVSKVTVTRSSSDTSQVKILKSHFGSKKYEHDPETSSETVQGIQQEDENMMFVLKPPPMLVGDSSSLVPATDSSKTTWGCFSCCSC